MGLFGKSAKQKFVEANPVPAGKEQLLGYGALLLEVNGHITITLKMQQKAPLPEDLLGQFWGVTEASEAKERIQQLLTTGNRAEQDNVLCAYLAGDTSVLDMQTRQTFDGTKDWLSRAKVEAHDLTEQDVQSVQTILGWDLERAAFVARTAYNAGYLTEEETWKVLELVDKAASGVFATWSHYFVSYMYGRSLVMSSANDRDNISFMINARMIAHNKDGVWKLYPRT